jgi:hypothetical protein
MNFSPSDILFIVLVLWIAIELLNNGGWGGGRRSRVDVLDRAPAECAAA